MYASGGLPRAKPPFQAPSFSPGKEEQLGGKQGQDSPTHTLPPTAQCQAPTWREDVKWTPPRPPQGAWLPP